MKNRFKVVLPVLIFSTVACRPVLAIGWGEFLILVVVVGVLLGPPLYGFIRRIKSPKKQKDK
jgi:hypothetical protein